MDMKNVFEAPLFVYRLEEIMGEKVRALIQFDKKLHERGWGRSRARDYYDLWNIAMSYGDCINFDLVRDVVTQKCQNKEILFDGYHQLFSKTLMEDLEESWEKWVRPLVPTNFPNVNVVIEDIKRKLLKTR